MVHAREGRLRAQRRHLVRGRVRGMGNRGTGYGQGWYLDEVRQLEEGRQVARLGLLRVRVRVRVRGEG